jgi:hypothetical protein
MFEVERNRAHLYVSPVRSVPSRSARVGDRHVVRARRGDLEVAREHDVERVVGAGGLRGRDGDDRAALVGDGDRRGDRVVDDDAAEDAARAAGVGARAQPTTIVSLPVPMTQPTPVTEVTVRKIFVPVATVPSSGVIVSVIGPEPARSVPTTTIVPSVSVPPPTSVWVTVTRQPPDHTGEALATCTRRPSCSSRRRSGWRPRPSWRRCSCSWRGHRFSPGAGGRALDRGIVGVVRAEPNLSATS